MRARAVNAAAALSPAWPRRAGFFAFAPKPPRFRGPVAAPLPAAAPPTAAPFALKLTKAELLAFRGVPRAIAVASLPRGR
jgi:hypothetical protein